ncbi:transposase [Terrisporobacter glycolicus]|nr:transposase [Terrisporobacter glycolicus]
MSTEEIQSIYDDNNGIYGSPKIHKVLFKKFNVSIKKVQRIMSKLGLKSVIVKKFKHHITKVKIEDKDNILN